MPDLVDACENMRMGTALFAKVYRIVTKWYGNPTEKQVLPQVFDDAIIAWQTGYFEGTAVFRADDPAKAKVADRVPEGEGDGTNEPAEHDATDDSDAAHDSAGDPNKAGIRIDLSGIGAHEK